MQGGKRSSREGQAEEKKHQNDPKEQQNPGRLGNRTSDIKKGRSGEVLEDEGQKVKEGGGPGSQKV